MIASICSEPNVLEVLRIVNIIIRIIKIVVPIILILFMMIEFMKAISSGDSDALAKAKKNAISKMIAAALIFLMPTFVKLVVNVAAPNTDYYQCLVIHSKEEINEIYNRTMDGLLSKAEESLDRTDLSIAKNYLVFVKDEESRKIFQARINALEAALKADEEEGNIIDSHTPESNDSSEPNDSNNANNSNSSNNSGSKPTANPIKDKVDINAVNKAIANAVNSKGLYTREAVVSVAKTVVNELNGYNYRIPYQLGGMYHRGKAWGLNPSWGTVIMHNNKYVLSGLDCRNFVNWCFKQAGLSTIRGFGYEGSTTNKNGDVYSNFGDGRPGDVIDANEHIMLIIENDKGAKTYTVAESFGGVGVRIKTYTYSELQNYRVNGNKIKYRVYNYDGMYTNKGYWCSSDSVYRPYPGSCHIPKSEFPSYYGY